MRHSDYHTLVTRGRKAGLSTRDLYAALASKPPEGSEQTPGQADGNGFVAVYDQDGHPTYRPGQSEPR